MLNVIDTPHYWYYDGEYRLKKEIVKKFNLTPLEKIVFEILLEAECLTYDNIAEQLPAGKWNSRSIYSALVIVTLYKIALVRATFILPLS